jgi:hypothetical protein
MHRVCLLLVLLAAGCSKHPSYGTVQPQDTAKVQPPPKFQEPRPGQDPAK